MLEEDAPQRVEPPGWAAFANAQAGVWTGWACAVSPASGQPEPLTLASDGRRAADVRSALHVAADPAAPTPQLRSRAWRWPCPGERLADLLLHADEEEQLEEVTLAASEPGLAVFADASYSRGPASLPLPSSPKLAAAGLQVHIDEIGDEPEGLQRAEEQGGGREWAPVQAEGAEGAEGAQAASGEDDRGDGGWEAGEAEEEGEEEEEEEDLVEEESELIPVDPAVLAEETALYAGPGRLAVEVEAVLAGTSLRRLRLQLTLTAEKMQRAGQKQRLELRLLRAVAHMERWEGPLSPGDRDAAAGSSRLPAAAAEAGADAADGPLSPRPRLTREARPLLWENTRPSIWASAPPPSPPQCTAMTCSLLQELRGEHKTFEVTAAPLAGAGSGMLAYSSRSRRRVLGGGGEGEGDNGGLLLLPGSAAVCLRVAPEGGAEVQVLWTPERGVLLEMTRRYNLDGHLAAISHATSVRGAGWVGGRM